MARTKIIWTGRGPKPEPAPEAALEPASAGDALVVVDRESPLVKVAQGIVGLRASVLPADFGGRFVPPDRLRALVFYPFSFPQDATAESIAAVIDTPSAPDTVAQGVAYVSAPGPLTVEVSGLEPGVEYVFVLAADFPD